MTKMTVEEIKTVIGKEITEVKHFEKTSDDFSALHSATKYLEKLGYVVGRICLDYPIAAAYNVNYVAKWINISNQEKKLIEAVIIPKDDFRNGSASVLIFE
jgi:hypothetical protein